MILAAGRGTRLGPLGVHTPKILIEVGGEPLLARHLRFLEREGVRRVVLNAHHCVDQLRNFIESYHGAVDLTMLVERALLGTAGGVRNALPHLGAGPFLVLYGDVLVEEPLAPLYEAHLRRGARATLAVFDARSTLGKGVVALQDDWRVVSFAEKKQEGPGLVNAGLYVLDRELVAALPAGVPVDFGHDVFPAALTRGDAIAAYRLSHAVLDIGTPEALELARKLHGRSPAPTTSPGRLDYAGG